MNKGYLKLSEAEEPHCFASHDDVRKEKLSKAIVVSLATTTVMQALVRAYRAQYWKL
jgi:hypothetical protein